MSNSFEDDSGMRQFQGMRLSPFLLIQTLARREEA